MKIIFFAFINKAVKLIDELIIHPIISIFWRYRNKNHSFTIISNNCWGGGIYQSLNLPYLTPTIGLYFYPDDYIEFVNNLDYYCMKCNLLFIKKSKYIDNINYPIGLLGNKVEIHFLHYKSEDEARAKWNRRVERINWNNIYIKMDDRDGCEECHLVGFLNLSYKKVFFSSKPSSHNSVVYLPKCNKCDSVGDLYSNKYLWRSEFDVVKWLNE